MEKTYNNIPEVQKLSELKSHLMEIKSNIEEKLNIINTLDVHIYRIKQNTNGEYVYCFSEGKIAEKYNISTKKVKNIAIKDVLEIQLYQQLTPCFEKAFEGKVSKLRGFVFYNRYHSTIISPYKYDDKGKVIEICGNTQDITEIYEVEKKFKEKTDVLDHIIEYNPYSIQICDSKGFHLKYNKSFIKIFQKSPEKTWSLFDDPLLKSIGLIDEIIKIKEGEIVEIPEVWYNTHEVDAIYPDILKCLKVVHFPIFNSRNELKYIIIMHEDITSKANLKIRIKELEEFQELSAGRELLLNKLEKELEDLKTKVALLKNTHNNEAK